MRERLPLVPEDLLPHPGAGFRAFVRSIIVSTRARIDRKGQSPAEIACKAWPNDRQLELLLRAPAPHSTTDSAGAVARITTEYLAAMAPLSAAAALIDAGFKLRFGRAAQIYVPSITTAPQMIFVGEGEALPVAMGVSARLILSVHKLAGIVAFSRELFEYSHPEDMVRQIFAGEHGAGARLGNVQSERRDGDATARPVLRRDACDGPTMRMTIRTAHCWPMKKGAPLRRL
jgi:hypothetical protein